MHVDASDYRAGAVLLQENKQKLIIQLVTFHKSLTHISVIIEKETLALILALSYFDFYLSAARFP